MWVYFCMLLNEFKTHFLRVLLQFFLGIPSKSPTGFLEINQEINQVIAEDLDHWSRCWDSLRWLLELGGALGVQECHWFSVLQTWSLKLDSGPIYTGWLFFLVCSWNDINSVGRHRLSLAIHGAGGNTVFYVWQLRITKWILLNEC